MNKSKPKPGKLVRHFVLSGVCFFLQVIDLIPLQSPLYAQSVTQLQSDTIRNGADLNTCLQYAMKHQPVIQQLQLSEEISRRDVGIALSDWFPQVDAVGNFQQYLKLPVSIFPNLTNPSGPKSEITTGVKNSSTLALTANQVIFNSDVFLAGKTARYYKLRSVQTTRQGKIELVVQISKAFYDVLLSNAQMNFLLEDRSRLEKSMKDAKSQYETGVSDKIDYQRALIAVNNINAEINGTQEDIKAKYAYLKELIGYPDNRSFTVAYDSLKMMKDSWIDTLTGVNYQNRIEYQLLLTRLKLQKSTVDYYKAGFLPSLSAFANYNLVYQNDLLNEMFNRDYPNSAIGLKLSFPIFQGTRRIQQVKRANLQYREMALDSVNLKNRMSTEYVQAIAAYKSNLKSFQAARENSGIANEVYTTVRLQYSEGIKTYLEVIVSETDLRTSRINELNALFRLLSSKIDVENALGTISVNY
jgi:outer membrane protein